MKGDRFDNKMVIYNLNFYVKGGLKNDSSVAAGVQRNLFNKKAIVYEHSMKK